MDAGTCFILFVMLFAAFLMLMIGILQIKSKKPVGFYAGETGPDETELTNTQAWNRKHGILWILYGITIVITSLIGVSMIDSVWCIFPLIGGVVLPVPIMTWYHHKLIARYRVKKSKAI